MEPEWKQAYPWCAEKFVTQCSGLSFTSPILTAQSTLATLFSKSSSPPTVERASVILAADVHGLAGNERKIHTLTGRKLVVDQLHRTFLGKIHKTSQRKRTLTTFGTCWQSNMCTHASKAETL